MFFKSWQIATLKPVNIEIEWNQNCLRMQLANLSHFSESEVGMGPSLNFQNRAELEPRPVKPEPSLEPRFEKILEPSRA